MSLIYEKLSDQQAVFDEWIAKNPKIKPFSDAGMGTARSLGKDDLMGFRGPPGNWQADTRQQRARTGATGTDPSGLTTETAARQTPSTYTVVPFSAIETDRAVDACRKGKNATGTEYRLPVLIVWETATNPPPTYECARFTIKSAL